MWCVLVLLVLGDEVHRDCAFFIVSSKLEIKVVGKFVCKTVRGR